MSKMCKMCEGVALKLSLVLSTYPNMKRPTTITENWSTKAPNAKTNCGPCGEERIGRDKVTGREEKELVMRTWSTQYSKAGSTMECEMSQYGMGCN